MEGDPTMIEKMNRPTGRRDLLRGAAVAAIAMAVWPVRGVFADTAAGMVTIVPFSDKGEAQTPVQVAKVVMTDAEWKAKLPAESYYVARHEGTERPFTGPLLNEHGKGIFGCICCGTALFDSATKFDSHTGWPSFWQPIAKENVSSLDDHSLGMDRTEVRCARCEGHLGHVFDDGPKPTGLRYCMNSVSLKFTPVTA
jgi:peptide-methionine (R)-S-oxide reductase